MLLQLSVKPIVSTLLLSFVFLGCEFLEDDLPSADMAFVSDSIDELIAQLDSRKYAIRQEATQKLIQECKKSRETRSRIQELLKSSNQTVESGYRLRKAVRLSQTVTSFADAETLYYKYLGSHESSKELVNQQKRVATVLTSKALEEIVALEARVDELQHTGEWEHDRLMPTGPGLFRDWRRPRENKLLDEARQREVEFLEETLALVDESMTSIDRSTFRYQVGNRSYIVRHLVKDVFKIYEATPLEPGRKFRSWSMDSILPADHALPPLGFPKDSFPLEASLEIIWSPTKTRYSLAVQDHHDLANPVATYFADLYPNWYEKIAETAKPSSELNSLLEPSVR